MTDITIKQLEYFLETAERGSFTEAAVRLHTTQSSVSITIAALEEALGTALFERSNKKKILLTEPGRILVSYSREILTKCDELCRVISPKYQKRLHIGASSVPAQCLMPGIIAGFVNQSSDCVIVLHKGDTASVHDMLKEKKVRLGLVGAKLNEAEFDYTPIAEDRMVVIAPNTAEYRALKTKGVFGEDIIHEPIILREASSGSRMELEKFLEKQGINAKDLNVAAEMDTPANIVDFVAEGVGISVVSGLSVAAHVKEGKVIEFSFRKEFIRPLYLVTQKGFKPTQSERLFMSFMG